jgi:hypothetical protein
MLIWSIGTLELGANSKRGWQASGRISLTLGASMFKDDRYADAC